MEPQAAVADEVVLPEVEARASADPLGTIYATACPCCGQADACRDQLPRHCFRCGRHYLARANLTKGIPG